jgi:hypothetical protein
VEDLLDAVEGGGAAGELALELAHAAHRVVAEVQRRDHGEDAVPGRLRAVGHEEGAGDAEGGDELDHRGDREGVLVDLHLQGEEAAHAGGEALVLVLLEAEGADFAGGGEVLAEQLGDIAAGGEGLLGALVEVAADDTDGQHADRDDAEAEQEEAGARDGAGDVDDVADRAQEGDGQHDHVVGGGEERLLRLLGVGDTAGEEIAAARLLEEAEREALELGEEIAAEAFEDDGAAVGDEVGVEKQSHNGYRRRSGSRRACRPGRRC